MCPFIEFLKSSLSWVMDSRLLTSSSSSGGMGMEGTCPKEIFKLKKKKVDSGLTEYYICKLNYLHRAEQGTVVSVL